MIFGTFIPQGWKMELAGIADPQDKWAKAVEIAVLAEQLGYDSVWVYDHFHNVPVPAHETMFEAWTTLAAISQRTNRVHLGQMVGCAPYRNPGLLAKITSNIDVMSGGRLDLGIGAGWYEHEYKAYGYGFPPAADRIRMLRETVEIVTSMWSEPDTTYAGGSSPSTGPSATRSRCSSPIRPSSSAAAASNSPCGWWPDWPTGRTSGASPTSSPTSARCSRVIAPPSAGTTTRS